MGRVKIQNLSPLGAGQQGAADRTMQSVPMFSNNPETFTNYLERFRAYVAMYQQSWEARKVVNIPIDDSLRKPFLLKGISDEASTVLKKRFDELQLIPTLKRSLKLERLLGGCLTFMGIVSEKDEPEKPHDPKSGAKCAFLNSIPVSRISRTQWNTDPLSPEFMRPDNYVINGTTVHKSRCLIWDGEPLFDPQDIILTPYRSNLTGFGPSVLGSLFDDIIMACGTRQAAYQLIQINGAVIAAIEDLQDLSGTNPGQRNLKKIQEMVNQLSAFRAAIVDGEKVDISQHSASFGSVPELLMSYLQVLSAASDIPASRFLGEAPGGLSTGDDRSSKENYYNKLDAFQHERITPQLLRFCDVIGYAEVPNWGKEREALEIEWPPLWNETAKEQAERASLTIDNVMKLVDAALMGDEQAIEEINARGVLSVKLEKDDLQLLGEARDAVSRVLDGGDEDKDVDAGKQIERLKNMSSEWITRVRVRAVAESLGITSYDFEQVRKGAHHEMEHQDVLSWDNVDDRTQVIGIALDHLREDPQYYEKLERIENAFPHTLTDNQRYKVKQEGRSVALLGKNKYQNPYPLKSEAYNAWLDGWKEEEEMYHKQRAQNALNLSPLPEPTEAQIASGAYKKHHIRLHGLDIAIENPKGSVRKGVDPVTKKVWSVTMPYDYGYIKRTEGADGDHVDVCIGPDETSDKVWVVDQVDLNSGAFDEHKCVFGCANEVEAMALYQSGFSDGHGHDRMGAVTGMSMEEFKIWLKSEASKNPAAL